jgi:acyl-CoA synthetase (AMP-forming)/AMP-acid ligase II/ankyrin repeat protein
MDRIIELVSNIDERSTIHNNQNEDVVTKPSITEDGILIPRDTNVINFVGLVTRARRMISSLNKTEIEDIWEYHNNQQRLGRDVVTSEGKSLQETVMDLRNGLIRMRNPLINNGFELTETNKINKRHKISHFVYTSGTSGRPKGCVSSTPSLLNYLQAKNAAHDVTTESVILLASSLSFDPCLSDILATFDAMATLAITSRSSLLSSLPSVIRHLQVTHVLCTPTLWSLTLLQDRGDGVNIKKSFPHLQVVALGGEPIPKRIVQVWSRPSSSIESSTTETTHLHLDCRLLATYGVTEACVYQTCGEVFQEDPVTTGQYVGFPLEGSKIRICKEDIQDSLVDVDEAGLPGEIVLFGKQVDDRTKYLHRPDLSKKFVSERNNDGSVCYHYRTGDRGTLNPVDGSLTIWGRIVGEEGMIKINGVRVELGEIEAAIVDDIPPITNNADRSAMFNLNPVVVTDCLATMTKDENSQKTLHAYCVLSEATWRELGIGSSNIESNCGFLIDSGPLWTLLRWRCVHRLKAACIPSAFVAMRQLPLSPTGKRDRSRLPSVGECKRFQGSGESSTPLKDYGSCGATLATIITETLNLQPSQKEMLTISASFPMIGGDSLSATIICRTLYATHLQVDNSRFLGGDYGQLPGPFNVTNLLRAKNFKEYIDILDRNNVCSSTHDISRVHAASQSHFEVHTFEEGDHEKRALFDALLQASTLGQSSIAAALLFLGADPNYGAHGGRLGKTSGRIEQRAKFNSSPLHLACMKGDLNLVKLLIRCKANMKSPNTNGLFPMHLAASSLDGDDSTPEESTRRLECIKALLDAGCPMLMRDANRQSLLHASARGGHGAIIEYCIDEYQLRYGGNSPVHPEKRIPPSHFVNWYDRWYRTPVHWAVLNGRTQALQVLLDKGCSPIPTQPKTNKHSSLATETPLEICDRLYGGTPKGVEMRRALVEAITKLENDI